MKLPNFLLGRLFIFVCILFLNFQVSKAQCDERAAACTNLLKPFHSDGQYYRAQILEGETVKMRVIFYSNLVYRIVSCNKSSDGKPLIIKIIDQSGKQIFSNESDLNSHWDFQFGATGLYTIQASYAQGDGCASLLIGYQSKDKYNAK